MIRIGLDTEIGMYRNSSDWLGINFYPILSPGNAIKSFRCIIAFNLEDLKQSSIGKMRIEDVTERTSQINNLVMKFQSSEIIRESHLTHESPAFLV